MKEIRQIVVAVSPEDEPIVIEEDNEEMPMKAMKQLLEIFDSEPPYFTQVIRPMLYPGHENELIFWMKDFGLIKTTQKCKDAANNDACSTMLWSSSRVKDRYQWICKGCKSRRSIREGSIFEKARCSFTIGIRIILGWCKGVEVETMVKMLATKKSVVEYMYKRLTHIAEQCILRNIQEWRIGGFGKLILIDTYPEGCANPSLVKNNHSNSILCLSEVGSFPQKSWLEKLTNPKQNTTLLRKQILSTIQRIVRSGSSLIIPSGSVSLGFIEEIAALRMVYPTILNVDMLSRHDNENDNMKAILETIWKNVRDKCEQMQFYTLGNFQEYITRNLWRTRYGNSSFEHLIYEIAS